MAAGLTGQIKLQSTMIQTLAAGVVNRVAEEAIDLNPSKVTAYSNGTTAGKVTLAYYLPLVFTISTPIIPNLSTIVCADGTVGMAYIREILLFNDSITDGQDIIAGGGTTPFPLDLAGTTPTVLVRAGAFKSIFSKPLGTTGLAVSTNVLLKLDPQAFAYAGRLLVLGHN